MSTDAPTSKSSDASAPDEPQAPVTHVEEPLVNPAVWRSEEALHHMRQHGQWEKAWTAMSERQKAAALEHIYFEILWDDLDQGQRDKALERIREDHDWPGRYARLEAEERERREQEAEQKRAREAETEREWR